MVTDGSHLWFVDMPHVPVLSWPPRHRFRIPLPTDGQGPGVVLGPAPLLPSTSAHGPAEWPNPSPSGRSPSASGPPACAAFSSPSCPPHPVQGHPSRGGQRRQLPHTAAGPVQTLAGGHGPGPRPSWLHPPPGGV